MTLDINFIPNYQSHGLLHNSISAEDWSQVWEITVSGTRKKKSFLFFLFFFHVRQWKQPSPSTTYLVPTISLHYQFWTLTGQHIPQYHQSPILGITPVDLLSMDNIQTTSKQRPNQQRNKTNNLSTTVTHHYQSPLQPIRTTLITILILAELLD